MAMGVLQIQTRLTKRIGRGLFMETS